MGANSGSKCRRNKGPTAVVRINIGSATLALSCDNADKALASFGPVSYTHLDVYKRQDLTLGEISK